MTLASLFQRVSDYDDYDDRIHVNQPKILVVGVGGAGCNAVSRMKHLGLDVPTIAINTDYAHLQTVDADTKIYLKVRTGMMGTGGNVDLGESSAYAARDAIANYLKGANIVFIAAGLGGGTGTGATPVIAEIARKMGAMVITIVTLPFKIEKSHVKRARDGLKRIVEKSNTVIVLENEKLIDMVPNRPLNEAFLVMDQLISYIIMSFVDIVTKPSLINIDVSDMRYIMEGGNLSTILLSEGNIDNVRKIVVEALNNPLMNVDYSTATGALIHMTVGDDAPVGLIYSTVDTVSSFLKRGSRITMGARVDPEYTGRMRLLVVLTGVKVPFMEEARYEEDREEWRRTIWDDDDSEGLNVK